MKRMNKLAAVAAAITLTGALGLSACDSTSPESDSSSSLVSSSDELALVLVSDLGLTDDEQSQVAALLTRHGSGGQPEPGFLWYVAEDLQERLTDEQKQTLFERAEAGPGDFRRQRRQSGGFRSLDGILTDEQKEQAQAIRESARTEIEAINAAVDSGVMTREEARDQIAEIHASVREQIEALLTEDQKAQLDELRRQREAEQEARREQAMEVRNGVLELTPEEIKAFDAIAEANRAAAEKIREQVRNQELTREEAHAAMQALRDDRYEQLSDLLDETQLEIVVIHDALALRMRHHRMQGPGGNASGQRHPGVFGSDGPLGGGFGFGSRG